MGKETKFLSIGIDLLKGILKEEGIEDGAVEGMNAGRLYDFLKILNKHGQSGKERRFNEVDYEGPNDRNRFHRNGMVENGQPLGNLFLETRCDQVGTPAQVKLFKLMPGETAENFNRVNGRITMIRDMTGRGGTLSRKLTEGAYVIEISKGSEYEIITDHLEIRHDTWCKKEYDLNRFVNLSKEGWIAGDNHHHSIYSSPVFGGDDDVVETVEEVANSMMAMGLEYGALSDHHNILNHSAWKGEEANDFTPILSKEISTSNGHVMAMGVDEDVIYEIPDAAHRTDEYLRSEFIRVTGQIKSLGGHPQINHPRDTQKAISWNPDFEDILDIFESMEIWNGSNPMMTGSTNDKALALWQTCMRRGLFIPATSGSDTHNICANDYHILFDRIMDALDIIRQEGDIFKEEYADEIHTISLIGERLLPILEQWAETSLTSGGVRTYLRPKGERNQDNILQALVSGHSFLTNGPILIPSVNGKGPGEKLEADQDANLEIHIRLLANRKLDTLMICSENGILGRIEITAKKENGFYDYSREIHMTVKDDHFLYFIARSDCTNLAISNPIICQ